MRMRDPIDLYQEHAARWDRERERSLFERPWLDRMLSLMPAGQSLLDLGCGSGEPIARHFINRGCAVTGVDSSSALIALCRDRLPGQEWIVADMRGLSLGRRFDGILAWDSFFHLGPEDQRRMFPTFREHAAPGTALMFTSGPSRGEAIATYEGERLYHASLSGGEYRSLLDGHGFDVVAHVVEDEECTGHTIWLARCR